jgi:hypothetical protein
VGLDSNPDSGFEFTGYASAFRRLIAWNSADLRTWGIEPKDSMRTPTKTRLRVDVAGRCWTKQQLTDMRLELTRWTSVDVYGRLWMAPRAGFEVERKFLSAQGMRTLN